MTISMSSANTRYLESGLQLDLPSEQHFRFADLPAYKKLSGQNLKEMDFAWTDTGKLILLEVRNYAATEAVLSLADFVPSRDQPLPFRFVTLIKKVTDSLLMLLAVWANTDCGGTINSELPAFAKVRLPLQIIIAIDLPPQLAIHLQPLRDILNTHLRGRLALVDVKSVALINYSQLAQNFSQFIKLQT